MKEIIEIHHNIIFPENKEVMDFKFEIISGDKQWMQIVSMTKDMRKVKDYVTRMEEDCALSVFRQFYRDSLEINMDKLPPTPKEKAKGIKNKSKFEVHGYDSFSKEGWKVGEYDTEELARSVAITNSGSMTLMYVYKDGQQLAKYGTF